MISSYHPASCCSCAALTLATTSWPACWPGSSPWHPDSRNCDSEATVFRWVPYKAYLLHIDWYLIFITCSFFNRFVYIYLSINLYTFLSIYLSRYWVTQRWPACGRWPVLTLPTINSPQSHVTFSRLSFFLFIHISIYKYICRTIIQSIQLSIYLSIYLFICSSIYSSIYPGLSEPAEAIPWEQ